MNERYFVQQLLDWHSFHNDRQLPWKNETDPYKVWVSEIILQQTRVTQGTAYYLNFLTHFPDVYALAAASEDLVYKVWHGLGYYARCRNMMAAARTIVEEHDGLFPDDYAAIRELKGIGPYTAAAISSFAFGNAYAVVDGNVKRVLARYFGIHLPPNSKEGARYMDTLAQQLIETDRPAAYNQAIMDFGATVCKPARPDCEVCPLQAHCIAYQQNLVASLPVRPQKAPVRNRYFHYIVLTSGTQVYLQQRKGRDIWQNLYDFPLLEHTKILSEKQLRNHPQCEPLFNSRNYRFKGISTPVVQKLTHQKITAVFVHFQIDKKLLKFGDARAYSRNETGRLAFPKIVTDYLATSDQIFTFDNAIKSETNERNQ